ncbi:hypothetical protein ACFUGD_01120 [Streptomyces sp. NPDC057217]|uniref:hypothetical protein n=1 Tax=Streptomyces sp. NPDC057217 TaxID=3346054 RepID=UPI00363D66EC
MIITYGARVTLERLENVEDAATTRVHLRSGDLLVDLQDAGYVETTTPGRMRITAAGREALRASRRAAPNESGPWRPKVTITYTDPDGGTTTFTDTLTDRGVEALYDVMERHAADD